MMRVEYLKSLWSTKLEIRVLLVSSLVLQILLLSLAGFRKRIVSIRWAQDTKYTWKGPLLFMFHWFLWLAYLLADYVATVALAYLRASEEIKAKHLLIFWNPFFLVHLGGQDTITALSVEDNELWARHLITLLTQVGLAWFNYITFNISNAELWPPAAIMFVVGMIKYCERIWSLQRASMSSLRSSMITKPDPGPNYAKFMQEYTSSRGAGLNARIIIEVERHKNDGRSHETQEFTVNTDDTQSTANNQNSENINPTYKQVVCRAYAFFPRFNRLFVDLILSYKDREDSQRYFSRLEYKKAYKLIEIELSWMYEILHSKASVFFTVKYYGWVSRVTTLLLTITALVLFAVLVDHSAYGRFNVALTYLLLAAAVSLEFIALCFMFLSFWTYATMKDAKFCEPLAEFLFHFQNWLRPEDSSRWSHKMAQFSLINYSLLDKPMWWKSLLKKLGLKQYWDNYRYTTFVAVNDKLKELVFEELKKKMVGIEDGANYKRYTEHRGEWALQRKGYYMDFGWSVEAEFDESILLWHIATDLLYNANPPAENEIPNEDREISQHISNYMMFLLIALPFMMPAGIGQIRFGDSSAEAKNFIQQQKGIDLRKAVNKILDVSTEFEPADIKGDRSKSLLFDGCKLAHKLQETITKADNKETVQTDTKNMWALISRVWVEMLCYAASKCSGQFHAKQLSKGGELLTVVWYLMAHLGMGEQYRIEKGHARAKLIIPK